MRVLEVTHYMPPHSGGIEQVAATLTSRLIDRGHDVRWISSATPHASGIELNLVRVRAWNVLEERLSVPYPLWGPDALVDLAREVRRADVVHVHDCLYMGSVGAAVVARSLKKPLLLTQHVGYVPFGRALDAVQRVAYQTIGRTVLSLASRRVAVSAHVPEFFAEIGVERSFRVVQNSIDETRFRPRSNDARRSARKRWGVPEVGRVALFVGRLVPKKGIASVVAAQRALAREGVTLVVVGDGPLASRLEGSPATRHIPCVSPTEMPEVYAMADVFVLTSRGEGLPLSVQEAMMCGLPSIVSTDPSFRANLGGAPGVFFTETVEEVVSAVLNSQKGLTSDEIAAWARDRWGGDRLINTYESILTSLATGNEVL